jgi:hypothetical protein
MKNNEHKITTVYWFQNDNLMVFDQNGEQMPEYQGRSGEMIPKIASSGFDISKIQRRIW